MSNRCPDCNKFVGLEAAEPEAEEPEVNDTNVDASIRVVLNCAECGSEMKEWNAELSGDISEEARDHAETHDEAGEEYEISAEWDGDPEVSDDMRPRHQPKPNKKTGKVKPVPYRYQIHYWKVSGTIKFTCDCGADLGNVELEDEIEASGFDELN